MPAWFLSQFRWWDDARWQLVTWSQKSEDVMLPQDGTAGFYILGSLMSLAMWSRRGQHPNEPRQWYKDHGIPWPWMAMRHQVKHAFQSMSNRICSSFNMIFQCLTVCTMTTANSSNTNPFCSLYCLFSFWKLFCNGVSFQLMMIVVAIFSHIPNVIHHFVEAIGVLTSTKLSHVLSSGGCEFV